MGVLELLVKHGAKVSVQCTMTGRTPGFLWGGWIPDMISAVNSSTVMVVNYCCGVKMSAVYLQVNTKDSQGQTALFRAARQGLVPVCRFLLANGGDPSLQSNDGLSADQVATPPIAKVMKEEVVPTRGNSDIEGQLLEASKNGDLDTMKVSCGSGLCIQLNCM